MSVCLLFLPCFLINFFPSFDTMNDSINIVLPAPDLSGNISIEEVLYKRRSIRVYGDDQLSIKEIAQLLWAGQGITDSTGGLRTAPSAGATYPIELYVVAGNIDGLEPGVYRYFANTHSLRLVLSGDIRLELSVVALQQPSVSHAPATILITGIESRTEQRYGRRAQRYVYMEAGHIAQNIYLQATALKIATVVVGAFQDNSVADLLSLGNEESVLYLMPVGKHPVGQ
jgi:SagB-type dehydrogenase family enzyme